MFGLSQREKNRAVIEAIYEGELEKLKKILAKGGDPEATQYSDRALFYAITRNSDSMGIQMVEALVSAGANLHQLDGSGNNIINYLVSNSSGGIEALKRLIDLGVDAGVENRYGQTPLMNALGRKNWKMSDILLDNGGAQKTRVKDGASILMTAVEGDAPIELITKILETTNVDINAVMPGQNNKLLPALFNAVNKGNAPLAKLLLSRPGINPDLGDLGGRTPLVYAVAAQRGEMVDILLKGKASPDKIDGNGDTPLLVAVKNSNKPLIAKLLQAGAKVDNADKNGRTALTMSAAADNLEMVEYLVKAGASLDLTDGKGETALSYAAQKGNIGMVKFIIAAAEEKQVKLSFGRAMSSAAERGNGRIIELLVAAGGDVNEPDRDGKTPLMKAVSSDQIETLGILVKAGAKAGAVDNKGLSAYDHAVSQGKGNAKIFLSRYRGDAVVKPQDEARPAAATTSEDYRFTKLNNYSLEVRDGDSLSMIFNFWTQQVILRDVERSIPMVVQSFADLPRQDAIKEAFEKLKEMGGTPPEPNVSSLPKKPAAAGLSRP